MKIIKSNGESPSIKPIKERRDIFVPDVSIQLPRRREFVYGLCGSGGSGKSSLLLSMFKSKAYYRGKFDNVWLFVPQSSFLSVEKHPFQNHEQVYHELTVDTLHDIIHDRLDELKEQSIENGDEIETSLIIIDDMADHLKDKHLVAKLNAMIIKSRH